MTNKTEMVSVSRELLERLAHLLYMHDLEQTKAGMDLDIEIEKAEESSAPAEDVRAVVEEPAGYALDNMLKRIKENPSFGHMIFGSPNGGYDVPLYRHPPRPVVLPERKQAFDDFTYEGCRDAGFNACLDAVEELNK